MWFPEKVTGNMEFVTVAKMQGRNVSKFPFSNQRQVQKKQVLG